jgi:SAM-dependent methyltransferase
MVTLPSDPANPPVAAGGGSHEQRQVAEGFGHDAERYDRARPTYPQELVSRIIAAIPGTEILDIGTGTGIVARLFQARGCRVLGVDPDPRMAGLARDRGLDVEVAKVEDWDPAGRQFDAAVAGQAWHWVDPVAGAATAARALRAGGLIAVFWNVFGLEPDMREAFGEVFRSVDTGLPFNPWDRPLLDVYLQGCDRAAEGMRAAGGFGEPEQWRSQWSRPYTRDEWLDVIPTLGGMNRVPDDKLAELLAAHGAVIDAVGGSFTVHYTTVAVTAVRDAGGGESGWNVRGKDFL